MSGKKFFIWPFSSECETKIASNRIVLFYLFKKILIWCCSWIFLPNFISYPSFLLSTRNHLNSVLHHKIYNVCLSFNWCGLPYLTFLFPFWFWLIMFLLFNREDNLYDQNLCTVKNPLKVNQSVIYLISRNLPKPRGIMKWKREHFNNQLKCFLICLLHRKILWISFLHNFMLTSWTRENSIQIILLFNYLLNVCIKFLCSAA